MGIVGVVKKAPRSTVSWLDQTEFARGMPNRWDLNLIADLMEEVRPDWEGVLEAHLGIVGADFWRVGEEWPDRHLVRAVLAPAGRPDQADPVFEFLYGGNTGFKGLTAADRCRPDKARAVLTAFLHNLAEPNSRS